MRTWKMEMRTKTEVELCYTKLINEKGVDRERVQERESRV